MGKHSENTNLSSDHEVIDLPEDLASLDTHLGEVLRERFATEPSSEMVDRIVSASLDSRTPESLPLYASRSLNIVGPSFRAAAAVLLVSGLAVAAWFASRDSLSKTAVPEPRTLAINFEEEIGVASAEEAILVAVLEGDGAWIDRSSFDRPGALEAEPVVRTRGTNVDDLADEITLILGATS